jgi:tetratricopeptide (TPR) repeat protein
MMGEANIARAQRIEALMRTEAYGEAAVEARQLANADPSAGAFHILAVAERAAGNIEAALQACESALALAEDAPMLLATRATLLDQLGRTSEALAQWRGLAEASLSSPDLAMSVGRALAYGGSEGEADELLARAVRRWPAHIGLQRTLAHLRWLDGGRPDFMRALEGALEANPKAAGLRAEGVRLLLQAGLNQRAEELARLGLEDVSAGEASPALVQVLAAALAEQGRLDEALAEIEKNGAKGLGLDRAVLLLRRGRAIEALAELAALPAAKEGDQYRIAIEALALRLNRDPGYAKLYDYDRLVRTYELAPPGRDIGAFNTALAKSLRALITDHLHPLDQTLFGGSQSTRDLRDVRDPIIQAFLAALDAPIRSYIDALDPAGPLGWRKRNGYKLSGAWSVRLRPGGYHVNHVHNLGWISSAYYVALPPSRAEDREARAGWLKFGEPPWSVPGASPELFIEPRAGMLALFPSYMLHGTVPFTQGEERLTAAFDVVPA